MDKKINYYDKIEDIPEGELIKRIGDSYNKQMPRIEEIPYVGIPHILVQYEYAELVALCPMTGLPDLYKITIKIQPEKFIPELKSLKYYFLGFANLPISHEHLASKIRKEICSSIKPFDIKVNLDVAVRGGIHTTIEV